MCWDRTLKSGMQQYPYKCNIDLTERTSTQQDCTSGSESGSGSGASSANSSSSFSSHCITINSQTNPSIRNIDTRDHRHYTESSKPVKCNQQLVTYGSSPSLKVIDSPRAPEADTQSIDQCTCQRIRFE